MSGRGHRRSSRSAGLAQALANIERKFGVGALQRLGAVPTTTVDVLPTGVAALDEALGVGGWPRGRICEIFGPEGVGVSTVLLHALAAAQQRGGIAALVDVDQAFDPEYARRIGCFVGDIFIARPDDGAMALEVVDALVRSGAFDVIALDSVAGLRPATGGERAEGARDGALGRARLLSEGLRRLAANIDRTRTVVLFGNRLAESHDDDGDDEATPGGRALRFYSSVRLGMRRDGTVMNEFGVSGARVRVTAVKNKVAPPLGAARLRLVYGSGFRDGSERQI